MVQMKKRIVFLSATVLVFLLNLNFSYPFDHQQDFLKFSMQYNIGMTEDGKVVVDLFDIIGFDSIVLENVSSNSKDATVYSSMSLTSGLDTDGKKPSSISVIMSVIKTSDPNVYFRVRQDKEDAPAIYIAFIPSFFAKRGSLSGGIAPKSVSCPPGCWPAKIDHCCPECHNSKCCSTAGGATYYVDTCTIRCNGGDCE
jgi:hypothetical protein